MNILGDIKTAILNYGRNGDNSLECFGIDLSADGIFNVKTYRYYRTRDNTIVDWSNDIGEPFRELIKHFEERKIIRFREISKDRTSNANHYKMYFSVKCNIPFEQHSQETDLFLKVFQYPRDNPIRTAEKYISSHLSPGRSPMLMLGAEICNHSIIALKSHMSLEKFYDYSQRYGEKIFFEELENVISDVSNLLFPLEEVTSDYLRIGQISSKYLFYPFMIGINQSDGQLKYKLYFRIKHNGLSKEEIFDNTIKMISYMDEYINVVQFIKMARELLEFGLFMEGFALEMNGKDLPTIKTYFFPLPTVKI